jgi:hypothetical protein
VIRRSSGWQQVATTIPAGSINTLLGALGNATKTKHET